MMRLLWLLLLLAVAQASAGTLSTMQFTNYSPLSGNLELMRRLVTPLSAARLPALLAQSKATLRDQAIDLSQEKFVVYVPSQAPPNGYGLLVFVPPWSDAELPQGWSDILDRFGVIFVSAAHSGNQASVMGRREPLAILAEQNIVQRYQVDPRHIFVGGFSGGSRVAMRLALGYPDIFRGALLDAGSDPIGSGAVPIPPRDLFEQFQAFSHLVYVTGDKDVPRLEMAAVSRKSMQDWCVLHIDAEVAPEGFHAAAGPEMFSRALALLLAPVQPDPQRLAVCRVGVDQELAQQFRAVEASIAAGEGAHAQELLNAIDRRFGGLAAPRSIALQRAIDGLPK